jgi:hypothetical protein
MLLYARGTGVQNGPKFLGARWDQHGRYPSQAATKTTNLDPTKNVLTPDLGQAKMDAPKFKLHIYVYYNEIDVSL